MTEVLKRKRTYPPTEAGFYYAVVVDVISPLLDFPDMETGERRVLKPSSTRRIREIVEVNSYGDGIVGIWDDVMEKLDTLPEEYEWYGPVPGFEEDVA